jgi:hypothetical protein
MRAIAAIMMLGFVYSACTTPLVTGRDVETEPISKTFNVPAIAAFEASEQALKDMDYKVS